MLKQSKRETTLNALEDKVFQIATLVDSLATKRAAPHGAQEYKGSKNHDWEIIDGVSSGDTARLRVPGGWLYYTASHYAGTQVAANMVFVPLPEVIGYAI